MVIANGKLATGTDRPARADAGRAEGFPPLTGGNSAPHA